MLHDLDDDDATASSAASSGLPSPVTASFVNLNFDNLEVLNLPRDVPSALAGTTRDDHEVAFHPADVFLAFGKPDPHQEQPSAADARRKLQRFGDLLKVNRDVRTRPDPVRDGQKRLSPLHSTQTDAFANKAAPSVASPQKRPRFFADDFHALTKKVMVADFQVSQFASGFVSRPGTSELHSASGDRRVQSPSSWYAGQQLGSAKSGTSCHQCKRKQSDATLLSCANEFEMKHSSEKRPCRKKYCKSCLEKFYHPQRGLELLRSGCETAATLSTSLSRGPVPVDGNTWICPSCLHECSCAACSKKRSSPIMSAMQLAMQSDLLSRSSARVDAD